LTPPQADGVLKTSNKGIDIPLSIKNILSSCRGVENDIQGDIARQSVISSLKEKDAKTITIYVLIISTLSLIISLIAILNKRY